MKFRVVLFILLTSALLTGCGAMAFAAPTPTSTQTATASPLPPTSTATVTPTPTITPTFTASLAPSPTWVSQGPDAVNVPILMYHHIAVSTTDSLYYVAPDKFDDELKLLHNWGYTTITTTLLTQAINNGAALPPRPIIITFDDANEDNYTNAFPIMQKYGFTGVLYLPFNYIDTPDHLTVAQIKEMTSAKWEVGSHSLSHFSLSGMDAPHMRAEIVTSKQKLETLLGVPVLTFAYPFGNYDSSAVDYVKFAGYIAAMGASGFQWQQGKGNLYVLQRSEIRGTEDAKTFLRFLPWQGDPSFIPTDTPTPTATSSRTPIPTYTQYPTKTPQPSPTP
jgi:peptidoglycan/xylan/chitin deacetylase (PgdA/CDA1 family)